MAKSKPRTDEQKKQAQDKRLQKEFGITLVERQVMERAQDFKCKLCDGPLDPPCVDHFHFKIKAFRHAGSDMLAMGLKWGAEVYDEKGRVMFFKHARTQAAAVADVRRAAMPWSIRGILCRHCNRALGVLERWFDAARTPDRVLPSLEYLRKRLTIE